MIDEDLVDAMKRYNEMIKNEKSFNEDGILKKLIIMLEKDAILKQEDVIRNKKNGNWFIG